MARQRREATQARRQSERLRDIADLLGGPKVVGKYPADPLAAHEMLERGLPNTAIKHLLDGATTLAQKSIESAIGMSERTRQRRERHPTELLSPDQAGRTWKFAEILTRAMSVFGSRTAAEQWLSQPATGPDQRRPIDLLTTPAGWSLSRTLLDESSMAFTRDAASSGARRKRACCMASRRCGTRIDLGQWRRSVSVRWTLEQQRCPRRILLDRSSDSYPRSCRSQRLSNDGHGCSRSDSRNNPRSLDCSCHRSGIASQS
jgi:putative toxin-antitoxin system antitoxin component (TIGR02293 family)